MDRDYNIERNYIVEHKFRVPDRERFGTEKSTYVIEIGKLSGIVVCE